MRERIIVMFNASSSLGTLVEHQGVYRLYTHNHYRLGKSPYKVLFYNANGEKLGEIEGKDFLWRMALAQDPGNAAIIAPDVLLPGSFATQQLGLIPEYAHFGNPADANVDMLVKVAHQQPGKTIIFIRPGTGEIGRIDVGIGVIDAKILSNEGSLLGVPVFDLLSQSVPIVKGDSGGGIWYQNRVIGNNWWTEKLASGKHLLEFGAAQLPNRYVNQ